MWITTIPSSFCFHQNNYRPYLSSCPRPKRERDGAHCKELDTNMLKGAAKTLTEMLTQIQPRTEILAGADVMTKCVRIRIKENRPTFMKAKSFIAEICSPKIKLT
ncbi:hypothetical protein SLA2020_123380 [Shorea laevis]